MIDVRHVQPRRERSGESIQYTLLRFIDLGHPQNVINVADDRQAMIRYQIGGCIACERPLGMDLQTLSWNLAHLESARQTHFGVARNRQSLLLAW